MITKTEQTSITATELARSLSDILNRVRYKGESFLIERNGEAVAVIGPVGMSARKGRTGIEVARLLRGLRLPEGFGDDLEAIHAAQGMPTIPEWPN